MGRDGGPAMMRSGVRSEEGGGEAAADVRRCG